MKLTEKSWYPILFMFVIASAASTVLIGFSGFTAQRVQANEQVAIERAVLESLGVDIPDGASGIEVHKTFTEHIKGPHVNLAGAYTLQKDGQSVGYSVPVSGQGFWAPIKGFIGVESDGSTIIGISFYQQNETPGLGAEITTYQFRSQFAGKELSRSSRAVGIRPISASLGKSDVHAVTGATQTSVRLEKMINESISRWRLASAEQGGAK